MPGRSLLAGIGPVYSFESFKSQIGSRYKALYRHPHCGHRVDDEKSRVVMTLLEGIMPNDSLFCGSIGQTQIKSDV
jgi:hypothetical protein